MNPLNPVFAIIIYFIALVTAYIINLNFRIINEIRRFETIDGIRGFLALGVFIHHSSIWYQYLQNKSWEATKSNFYNQLGELSVSFFFMITAFLFITKLLNAKKDKMNWSFFFISRFFRLVPMYLVSIFTLVIIVFIISNWEMKVALIQLVREIFCWITFTIPGSPLINDVSYTQIINAGVAWSLPYEWLFYFSLPIIFILIQKTNTSKIYIIISLLFILAFCKYKSISPNHIFSFICGSITPFLLRFSKEINLFKSHFFSLIILICLAIILFIPISNYYICNILAFIIFNLIVLGNSIFGILKNNLLKFLGDISYSTYLIHGIIIFVEMYFFYGIKTAANLSPVRFCVSIFVITPIVVLVSFLTYIFIEKPLMNYSKKFLLK